MWVPYETLLLNEDAVSKPIFVGENIYIYVYFRNDGYLQLLALNIAI